MKLSICVIKPAADFKVNVSRFSSKDVKIAMESDLQPLLQKSCESQFEKKPIELQTLGANPDEMDLLHDTCSSNNKTKQEDLETDGPPEISPTKIQKEGQLSNLNDERLKTDSPQELPQDHPMPATAQSKISFLKFYQGGICHSKISLNGSLYRVNLSKLD